jgi:hypothetical protein
MYWNAERFRSAVPYLRNDPLRKPDQRELYCAGAGLLKQVWDDSRKSPYRCGERIVLRLAWDPLATAPHALDRRIPPRASDVPRAMSS